MQDNVALNRPTPEPMPLLQLNSGNEIQLNKRWPRKKNGLSVVHRVEFLEAQYGFTKFLVEEKIPSMEAIMMQQEAMMNQMFHEMERMRQMLHCMAMANTTILMATQSASSEEVNPNGASAFPLPREPEGVNH